MKKKPKEENVALDGGFIPGIAPEVAAEMKQQEAARRKEDAQVIETLGEDFSLCSWGLSSPLKVTRGDKIQYIRLRLKSLGVAEVMERYSENMPQPPSTIKTYRKDSDVARQLGSRHDVLVRERDESDPSFVAAKQKHEADAGQFVVLTALNYDITYQGEVVVRGADVNAPSEVINAEKALKALRKWGISGNHFAQLLQDVRLLTAEAEDGERQE